MGTVGFRLWLYCKTGKDVARSDGKVESRVERSNHLDVDQCHASIAVVAVDSCKFNRALGLSVSSEILIFALQQRHQRGRSGSRLAGRNC